jgi:hypothetical protein
MIVEVYIRRRPTDGVAYATVHDLSKYTMEPALETLTVPIPFDDAPWDATKHPTVTAALDKLNADTAEDLM